MINSVQDALEKYLSAEEPEPHLVISGNLAPKSMLKLGFEKVGDKWVITLDKAKIALHMLTGYGIDYNRHTENEKKELERRFRANAG